MNLPMLVAVKVPWMIAPSSTYAELNFSEYDTSSLRFRGNEIKVSSLDQDSPTNVEEAKLSSLVLEATFENQAAIRIRSPYSENITIDPEQYDWSAIESDLIPYKSLSEEEYTIAYRNFLEEWITTKTCPVPQVYIVENSKWLLEFESQFIVWNMSIDHFYHYLFIFDECSIDIVASNWKWRILSTEETNLK